MKTDIQIVVGSKSKNYSHVIWKSYSIPKKRWQQKVKEQFHAYPGVHSFSQVWFGLDVICLVMQSIMLFSIAYPDVPEST